jgi:signal transduction histidine kinase
MAVHGVRVMADLQRSRERLVLAREEEQRRLRRNLHDELAPTLAALGLSAATVGELIPKEATSTNEKLQTAIRATVGAGRRLVYDLRPPRPRRAKDKGLIRIVDTYTESVWSRP